MREEYDFSKAIKNPYTDKNSFRQGEHRLLQKIVT